MKRLLRMKEEPFNAEEWDRLAIPDNFALAVEADFVDFVKYILNDLRRRYRLPSPIGIGEYSSVIMHSLRPLVLKYDKNRYSNIQPKYLLQVCKSRAMAELLCYHSVLFHGEQLLYATQLNDIEMFDKYFGEVSAPTNLHITAIEFDRPLILRKILNRSHCELYDPIKIPDISDACRRVLYTYKVKDVYGFDTRYNAGYQDLSEFPEITEPNEDDDKMVEMIFEKKRDKGVSNFGSILQISERLIMYGYAPSYDRILAMPKDMFIIKPLDYHIRVNDYINLIKLYRDHSSRPRAATLLKKLFEILNVPNIDIKKYIVKADVVIYNRECNCRIGKGINTYYFQITDMYPAEGFVVTKEKGYSFIEMRLTNLRVVDKIREDDELFVWDKDVIDIFV